jgi:hypothetical protein
MEKTKKPTSETPKATVGEKTGVKKSNITFGALQGKIKVAPDTWDDDLKQTITK